MKRINRASLKRIVLLLLMATPCFANAQFETDDYLHGLLVRGKLYAGPTSTENRYGRMWTIGGEARFFNHHSIGVDYVNYYMSYSRESYSVQAGYYENDGTFDIRDRNYVLIDYRYYFTWLRSPVMPYLNVLTKFGRQNEWFYDGVGPNVNIP